MKTAPLRRSVWTSGVSWPDSATATAAATTTAGRNSQWIHGTPPRNRSYKAPRRTSMSPKCPGSVWSQKSSQTLIGRKRFWELGHRGPRELLRRQRHKSFQFFRVQTRHQRPYRVLWAASGTSRVACSNSWVRRRRRRARKGIGLPPSSLHRQRAPSAVNTHWDQTHHIAPTWLRPNWSAVSTAYEEHLHRLWNNHCAKLDPVRQNGTL